MTGLATTAAAPVPAAPSARVNRTLNFDECPLIPPVPPNRALSNVPPNASVSSAVSTPAVAATLLPLFYAAGSAASASSLQPPPVPSPHSPRTSKRKPAEADVKEATPRKKPKDTAKKDYPALKKKGIASLKAMMADPTLDGLFAITKYPTL